MLGVNVDVLFQQTPLSSFPSGIFAGTQISPEALVQTLTFEEPSNDTGTPAQKGKYTLIVNQIFSSLIRGNLHESTCLCVSIMNHILLSSTCI